mmetsp:Transcript_17220/g.32717  ORF Transcript_17220/g.32717 Transcript_17220/m.32717 type:complete len:304 (+) Transcript_17220:690-1601(+)
MKMVRTTSTMSPIHQDPFSQVSFGSSPPFLVMRGAMTSETTLMSLMRMLREGPDVSLKGSPTVSPTTTALYSSVFLGWSLLGCNMPLPTYFLALSHAPPALDIITANKNPEEIAPASKPRSIFGPTMRPTTMGQKIASTPGITISLTDSVVQMSTHFWLSSSVPRKCLSLSCARHSYMIASAAAPTESMVRAAKTKGRAAPRTMPGRTTSSRRLTESRFTASAKAFSSARAVRTAEPMAKPFPVAAVVLPRASRESVVSRVASSTSSDISAIPPALSATGPKASVASVTPRVDNMATAQTAMP